MAIWYHPTPPVCTCLLLASGDRLDQDWWFLLGVVGTAPGEIKGVWEKNNALAQTGRGAHLCHPSTQKAKVGDGSLGHGGQPGLHEVLSLKAKGMDC